MNDTARRLRAEPCTFKGCLHPREGSELCTGHRKQVQRGKPLTPLTPKSPRERLRLALDFLESSLHRLEDARAAVLVEIEERGSAYANADTENDRAFRKAQREFYDAVEALGRLKARHRVVSQRGRRVATK